MAPTRRGPGNARRPRSLFPTLVATVGAVMLLQAGASIFVGLSSLRSADSAADDLFTYVGEATSESVEDFAKPALTAMASVTERGGGERAFGEGTSAQGPPLPEVSSGATPPDERAPFAARDLFAQLRTLPQVSGVLVVRPDGEWASISRTAGGFRAVLVPADPGEPGTLQLLGREGRVLSQETVPRGADPRQERWYSQAAGSARPIFLQPEFSTLSGRATAPIVAGGFTADAALAVVVRAEIDVQTLSTFLTDLPLGQDGEAFIFDDDRRLVAAPEEYLVAVRELEARTGIAPLASAIGVEQPAASTSDPIYRAGGYVILERVIGSGEVVPWTLHVRATESSLSPALTAFERTQWVYGAVVLVLVVALALVLAGFRGPLGRLLTSASTDPLTGLENRREFALHGREIVEAAHRRAQRALVVMIDMDRLKSINDVSGHSAGDAALRVAAEALAEASGPRDAVARLGGDEFAVVHWMARGEDPGETAEALRASIADAVGEMAVSARTPKAGASAGWAVTAGAGEDLDDLISAADAALVSGKRKARGATYAAPKLRR